MAKASRAFEDPDNNPTIQWTFLWLNLPLAENIK